ncbi:MAG: SNF2-related protein [Candidatus Hodarchaeota archaeon]
MKQATILKNEVQVRFKIRDTDEWNSILWSIKKINGSTFKPAGSYWSIPRIKENIDLLKALDFSINGTLELPKKLNGDWKKIEIDKSLIPGLRDYQYEAIKFLSFRKGRALIADQMGTGKTVQALSWLKYNNKDHKPVLIIVPASIKLQWLREFKKWYGDFPVEILKGRSTYPLDKNKSYIINWDILSDWIEELVLIDFALVIGDECFTYNTNILTEKGYVKIGELFEKKKAKYVLSYNFQKSVLEFKPIICYIKKERTRKLLEVTFKNGVKLKCTENHKFWSEDDHCYKEIRAFKNKERVCVLPQRIFDNEKGKINSSILFKKLLFKKNNERPKYIKKNKTSTSQEKSSNCKILRTVWEKVFNKNKATNKKETFLFGKMCYKLDKTTTKLFKKFKISRKTRKVKEILQRMVVFKRRVSIPKRIIEKNEGKQSYKKPRGNSKNQKNKVGKRNFKYLEWFSGRQWKGSYKRAISTFSKFGEWLDIRVCFKNKNKTEQWNPNELQNRHSSSQKENSNRNRWFKSLFKNKKSSRSKKDKLLNITRLESISILELGSSGKYKKNKTTDFVYNLEVADNNNYFANNILVSNCQAIGNPKSIRTKAFKKIAKKINQLIFLSGTPIRSNPSQFYTILHILDPETFPNKWLFLNSYCNPKFNGFGMSFKGLSNGEELHALISHLMIRREKKDILKDLPDKTRIIIPLDDVSLSEYFEKENEFKKLIGFANKKEIEISFEALKWSAFESKKNSVVRWIDNFIDSDEKLVVFAYHRKVVEFLYETYNKRAVRIYGGISQSEREKSIKLFQENDSIKLFIANILAGGIGIDGLQNVCSNSVTVEFAKTAVDHEQAEDRLHRINQTSKVMSYYLIAPETIEEDLIKIIDNKIKMFDQVVKGIQTDEKDLFSTYLQEKK